MCVYSVRGRTDNSFFIYILKGIYLGEAAWHVNDKQVLPSLNW